MEEDLQKLARTAYAITHMTYGFFRDPNKSDADNLMKLATDYEELYRKKSFDHSSNNWYN